MGRLAIVLTAILSIAQVAPTQAQTPSSITAQVVGGEVQLHGSVSKQFHLSPVGMIVVPSVPPGKKAPVPYELRLRVTNTGDEPVDGLPLTVDVRRPDGLVRSGAAILVDGSFAPGKEILVSTLLHQLVLQAGDSLTVGDGGDEMRAAAPLSHCPEIGEGPIGEGPPT